jgi:hypothetical protein
MVQIKHSEMRVFDDAFAMHGGYVLNFSDRTFSEFLDDEFGINIYDEKYRFNGSSKAKHMRAFIATEDEFTVARVLRRLWEYRESIPLYQMAENSETVKKRFFDLLARIEGGGAIPRTDAIDRFKRDETLDELAAAIERRTRSSGRRIPAGNLEGLVTNRLRTFLADPGAILDAVDNDSRGGPGRSQLIERGRQIAEDLGALAPDKVKAALMALFCRVEIKSDRVDITLSRGRLTQLLAGSLDLKIEHQAPTSAPERG